MSVSVSVMMNAEVNRQVEGKYGEQTIPKQNQNEKSNIENCSGNKRRARVTFPSLIAVVMHIKKQSLQIGAEAQHGSNTRSSLS